MTLAHGGSAPDPNVPPSAASLARAADDLARVAEQREDVLAQALRELADHIAEKTGCPVYLGEAPAAAKT